ncbi:MAG: 50S ribosomal protein L6 [Holosporales bacterium]|nr:50S ribosomal protein L6 [Holosporales bacterium]
MSRVGKHVVAIPQGIEVALNGNAINTKKGSLESSYEVPSCIKVEHLAEGLLFTPNNSTAKTRSIWGTSQRNVGNMIRGLATGFKVDLELIGVGYKASVNGKKLIMQLGYSHDIEYEIPDGITISCTKPTTITVGGHSKKQVGDVAALLRGYRKPEPYKGKGVVRAGEFVYRKEGKKK